MTKLTFKRIIFYIISFTWGALTTIPGLIGILCLLPFGRVHKFHSRLYGVIGKDWGGLEMGCFFFCSEKSANSDHLRSHECGHGLQNCLWGPLFILVIGIPSAIRYWYRELKFYRKGKWPTTDYDDIWFEGQATRWGKKYIYEDLI